MTDRKRCPACQQYLPHELDGIALSAQQTKILNAIRQAGDNGIATDDLVTVAYRGCRVPLTAQKIVAVMVWHINRKLVPHGYRVRNWRRGRNQTGEYFLIALNERNVERTNSVAPVVVRNKIRTLYATGQYSYAKLARMFGIKHRQNVFHIVRGREKEAAQ